MGCDKNVIVLCSYPLKSGRNSSNRGPCISLKDIVESRVFRTRQNSFLFSGARGREFESPWARHLKFFITNGLAVLRRQLCEPEKARV